MEYTLIFIVYWIIVPFILLCIFLFNRSVISKIAKEENRISNNAGFLAGLVLFIIYISITLENFQIPDFSKTPTIQFNLIGTIIGTTAGLIMLWGFKLIFPKRISAFFILFLTSASSSALYSYFFIQSFNTFLFSFALGTAFGALIHIMINPTSIKEIIKKPLEPTRNDDKNTVEEK